MGAPFLSGPGGLSRLPGPEFFSVMSWFDRLRDQLEKPAPDHIRGQMDLSEDPEYSEAKPRGAGPSRPATRSEVIGRIVADRLRRKGKEDQ